jgi:hypothetical protein
MNFIYEVEKRGLEILIRVDSSSAPEELLDFIESDSYDEIITISQSLDVEKKAFRKGLAPHPVEVRAVKYRVKETDYVILTTILDNELTLADIASLYHLRWGIEEEFKLTKVGLNLESFRSKHLLGILQEVWATQAVSGIARIISICTSGIQSKKVDRKQHSILGIAKILRVSLLQIISAVGVEFQKRLVILKKAIVNTVYRYRPNRSYSRTSKRKLNRWSLRAEGVSC